MRPLADSMLRKIPAPKENPNHDAEQTKHLDVINYPHNLLSPVVNITTNNTDTHTYKMPVTMHLMVSNIIVDNTNPNALGHVCLGWLHPTQPGAQWTCLQRNQPERFESSSLLPKHFKADISQDGIYAFIVTEDMP